MARVKMRLVSVRFSEDEYQSLKELCDTQGADSLSSLIRKSMRWIVTNSRRTLIDALGAVPPAPNSMRVDPAAVTELGNRLEQLNREMKRLSDLIPQ